MAGYFDGTGKPAVQGGFSGNEEDRPYFGELEEYAGYFGAKQYREKQDAAKKELFHRAQVAASPAAALPGGVDTPSGAMSVWQDSTTARNAQRSMAPVRQPQQKEQGSFYSQMQNTSIFPGMPSFDTNPAMGVTSAEVTAAEKGLMQTLAKQREEKQAAKQQEAVAQQARYAQLRETTSRESAEKALLDALWGSREKSEGQTAYNERERNRDRLAEYKEAYNAFLPENDPNVVLQGSAVPDVTGYDAAVLARGRFAKGNPVTDLEHFDTGYFRTQTTGKAAAQAKEKAQLLFGSMNEEQKAYINYLYGTYDQKTAEKLTALWVQNMELEQLSAKDNSDRRVQNAVGNVLGSMTSSPLYAGEMLGNLGRNMLYGTNNAVPVYSQASRVMREQQAAGERFVTSYKSPIGQFLAQTGLSIARNVANRVSFGGAGLAMMGLQAFSDDAYQMAEAGEDGGTQLMHSLISAGSELATEKISWGKLDDILGGVSAPTLKALGRQVGAQMVTEFGEEAINEAVNILGDWATRGEDSDLAAICDEYYREHPSEAGGVAAYAAGALVMQILEAGASGAVSGGIMGGSGAAVGTARLAARGNRMTQANKNMLLESARQYESDPELAKAVELYQQKGGSAMAGWLDVMLQRAKARGVQPAVQQAVQTGTETPAQQTGQEQQPPVQQPETARAAENTPQAILQMLSSWEQQKTPGQQALQALQEYEQSARVQQETVQTGVEVPQQNAPVQQAAEQQIQETTPAAGMHIDAQQAAEQQAEKVRRAAQNSAKNAAQEIGQPYQYQQQRIQQLFEALMPAMLNNEQLDYVVKVNAPEIVRTARRMPTDSVGYEQEIARVAQVLKKNYLQALADSGKGITRTAEHRPAVERADAAVKELRRPSQRQKLQQLFAGLEQATIDDEQLNYVLEQYATEIVQTAPRRFTDAAGYDQEVARVSEVLKRNYLQGLATGGGSAEAVELYQQNSGSGDTDTRSSVIGNVVAEDGSVYNGVVSVNSDIFKGHQQRDWKNQLKTFVSNKLAGKMVTTFDENGNSHVVQFAKENERVRKDGDKNSHLVLGKLQYKNDRNSQLAVANAVEMVEVSFFDGNSDTHNHQWLDENGWEFRKAYMMLPNGKIYEATLNIARTRDGRSILYDINKIHQVAIGKNHANENPQRSKITNLVNDGIVHQNGADVKQYSVHPADSDNSGNKNGASQFADANGPDATAKTAAVNTLNENVPQQGDGVKHSNAETAEGTAPAQAAAAVQQEAPMFYQGTAMKNNGIGEVMGNRQIADPLPPIEAASKIRQAENGRKAAQDTLARTAQDLNATDKEMNIANMIAAGKGRVSDFNWEQTDARKYVVEQLVQDQVRVKETADKGVPGQKREVLIQNILVADGLWDRIMSLVPGEDWEALPGWIKPVRHFMWRNSTRVATAAFGDTEAARYFNEHYINPAIENDENKVLAMRDILDKVRKFKLNRYESTLTQLVGEGLLGENVSASSLKLMDILEKVPMYARGNKEVVQLAKNMDKVDAAKVVEAAATMRKLYDDYHDVINAFRLQHGLEEIGKIDNYMPHMREMDRGMLHTTLRAFGLEEMGELPTQIAGLTVKRKPNTRFVGNFLHREGPTTTYDAVAGFEAYTNAVMDMLYHTDDIMKLRVLSRELRKNVAAKSQSGIVAAAAKGQRLEELRRSPDAVARLNEELSTARIEPEQEAQAFNGLVVWIDEYANKLANKGGLYDRLTEGALGRGAQNLLNKIVGNYGKAAIVGNARSAITNVVTVPKIMSALGAYKGWEPGEKFKREQGKLFDSEKYARRALQMMASAEMREIYQESSFLQSKDGVKPLAPSVGEQISDKLGWGFEQVERAVSRFAFTARYLQNMDALKGKMSPESAQREAVKEANEFCADMMARRNKAAKPLLMQSRDPILRLITMFQVEVSNDWYWLRDDLPQSFRRTEKLYGKNEAAKELAAMLVRWMLYSFTLGHISEEMFGFNAFTDPIGWGLDFFSDASEAISDEDASDWEKAMGVGGAVWGVVSNVANMMPAVNNGLTMFGQGNGRVPTPDIVGVVDSVDDLVNSQTAGGKIAAGADVALTMAQLIGAPGAGQLAKTAKGAGILIDGGKRSKDGQLLAVTKTGAEGMADALRGLLFGQGSMSSVSEYYETGRAELTKGSTEGYDAARGAGVDKETALDFFKACQRLQPDKNAAGETVTNSRTRKIYEYANSLALPVEQRAILLQGALSDTQAEKLGRGLGAVTQVGVDPEIYLEWLEFYYGYNGEKKKEKVKAQLYMYDLTDEQRRVILGTMY